MKQQIIVTIGREYGSAGHFIAEKLSDKLEIALYDRKFMEGTLQELGYSKEIMEKYDEKPSKLFFSRKVGNYSNSIEETVAQKVFAFIQEKADSGESFVVVGRCSDSILRQNKNAVKIFIMGNEEEKIARIMEVYHLSKDKAKEKLKRHDKKRKQYHNTYSDIKWGDSRGYDICINSSTLGIDPTVEVLYNYITHFMG